MPTGIRKLLNPIESRLGFTKNSGESIFTRYEQDL